MQHFHGTYHESLDYEVACEMLRFVSEDKHGGRRIVDAVSFIETQLLCVFCPIQIIVDVS
jgi:hypothetical protein